MEKNWEYTRDIWLRLDRLGNGKKHLSPAPYLVTYMGRQNSTLVPFRFVLNKSKAVAANSYHLLYPQPQLQAYIDGGIFSKEEVFSLLQ